MSVLLFLEGKNAGIVTAARDALEIAFPGGIVVSIAQVGEAVKTPPAGTEILVLVQPSEESLAVAVGATDATGLPRWAVVVCAEERLDDAVESIAPVDWNPRLVAQVFRSALSRLHLQRENARFRGDLLTIGTRLVHDLRSPLGGVLTSAEVLKEILSEEAPAHVPITKSIIDSAEEQLRMLRHFSFFAKTSAQPVSIQRLNMGEPFWSALQQVEKSARTAGATIAQPGTWPEVMGDVTLLEGVWQHLLANAIGHSRSTEITAGWERQNQGLRFWVRDRGTIPEEKRRALFEPFHLLHEPNAPRGWGLAIVRRLVDLQGGSCGYELTEGGSCFYFTLPSGQGP